MTTPLKFINCNIILKANEISKARNNSCEWSVIPEAIGMCFYNLVIPIRL